MRPTPLGDDDFARKDYPRRPVVRRPPGAAYPVVMPDQRYRDPAFERLRREVAQALVRCGYPAVVTEIDRARLLGVLFAFLHSEEWPRNAR
ncbi:hypothetical protein HNR23_000790 [Nocardiopsis mwathae]|uniref:Uncharacterized protein n=1 Tax=Nocardiopsis mwathae TaxID=1472723 RepID=A0A7W9YF13_9ACTN|nr:hypothetical protein [Nocardiopsis mwathae]MBB6170730.1 hypothetical protein [Nocardiopsis mwathae]